MVIAFEETMLKEQSIGFLDYCENAAWQTGGLNRQAIFEWDRKEDNLTDFIC
jgi:hypothetical protein